MSIYETVSSSAMIVILIILAIAYFFVLGPMLDMAGFAKGMQSDNDGNNWTGWGCFWVVAGVLTLFYPFG